MPKNNAYTMQNHFIHALNNELDNLNAKRELELSVLAREYLSSVSGCVQELTSRFTAEKIIRILLNGFVDPDYDTSFSESYSGDLECSYNVSFSGQDPRDLSDNFDSYCDSSDIDRSDDDLAKIQNEIGCLVEFCAKSSAHRIYLFKQATIYRKMLSKLRLHARIDSYDMAASGADAAAGHAFSQDHQGDKSKKVATNERLISDIMQLAEGIFMAAVMLYLSFYLDMAQTLGYVKSDDSLNHTNRTILRLLSLVAFCSALSVIRPVYEKFMDADVNVQRQLRANITDYMQDMFSYANFNQTVHFIHFMKCHYYLVVMPPRWRQIKSLSDNDKSILDGEDFIRSKRRQRDVCLLLLGVFQYPTPQNLSSQAGGMVFTEVRNLVHFCVPEPLRMPICVLMLLALILPSILYLIDSSVLPLMCKLVWPFAIASADKNVFASLIVVSLTLPFVHVLFGLSALAYFLYEIPKQLMSNSFSLSTTLSGFTHYATLFCMLTTLLFLLAEHAVPNFMRNEYNAICGDVAFSGILATLPLVLKVGGAALMLMTFILYHAISVVKTPLYSYCEYGACGVFTGLAFELLRLAILPVALGKAYAEVAQTAGVRFSEAMSKPSHLEKPKYAYCARAVEISLDFVPLVAIVYYLIHSFDPIARASSLGVMQYAELYTLLAVNSGVISAFYDKAYACNSEVGDVNHRLENFFFKPLSRQNAGDASKHADPQLLHYYGSSFNL